MQFYTDLRNSYLAETRLWEPDKTKWLVRDQGTPEGFVQPSILLTLWNLAAQPSPLICNTVAVIAFGRIISSR